MTGMTLGNITRRVDITHLNNRQKDEVSYGSRLGGGTNARWWLMGFRNVIQTQYTQQARHQVAEMSSRLIQGGDLPSETVTLSYKHNKNSPRKCMDRCGTKLVEWGCWKSA
jgi:hypothetical protein